MFKTFCVQLIVNKYKKVPMKSLKHFFFRKSIHHRYNYFIKMTRENVVYI